MATVYLARDLKHKRPVALKVLHAELAATLGPERFEREIETVARLQHPHILSVLDSGEAAGRLWFTMPYIDGESLRDRLRRERQLPLEDAVRITREAAQALGYAHRHGVVHRDVKPENLLLTEDGNTLVADFGVARALAGGETQLTETGLVVGTPTYMSPEQASGTRDLDPRSDVYALATVLYEMLAGEPPFTGATPQAVLARRFTETPRRLCHVRETVPETIDEAVAKALAKAPADRFQTAAEFARALTVPAGLAVAAGSPAGAPDTPWGTTPNSRAPPRRPRSLAITVFGLGILISVGVLFQRLRTHWGERVGGAKVLAVLPFQNQGAPQDEYFADGVADAVRGKLATVQGLEVIARESSAPYRKTGKSPEQIARELGARYLLTGTVRWEKGNQGPGRVLVSPELVEVVPGRAPRAKWQEPFEAALTNLFQVQGDIAGRVTEALDVALGASEQQSLAAKPTNDPTAYDYYLRGNAYAQRGAAEPDLRRAAGLFEQAVALDPSFALAYAGLARAQDLLYWFWDRTEGRLAKEKAAADQAVLLRPDLAEGHLALGMYYYHGHLDYRRALGEFEAARRLQPSNGDIYSAIGVIHRKEGRWAEALADQKKAVELNPRSAVVLGELATTETWIRAYAEAESYLVRATEIGEPEPPYVWRCTLPLIWRGDTATARRIFGEALGTAGPERTLPILYQTYGVMIRSMLRDALYDTALARVPLSSFGSDTAAYYRWKAEFHAYQGNLATARAFFDSARVVLEARAARQPDQPGYHALLAGTYAELGRRADAQREGQRAVALRPVAQDAMDGTVYRLILAQILAKTGQPEAAVDQLAYLLSIPSPVSVPLLRVDRTWDGLRGNPRFERLLASR
jgi:serine/threonine-protein kinase